MSNAPTRVSKRYANSSGSGELGKQIREAAQSLIVRRVAEHAGRHERVRKEAASLLEREALLSKAFTAGDLAPNLFRQELDASEGNGGKSNGSRARRPPQLRHSATG
jgi:hypothetical protein